MEPSDALHALRTFRYSLYDECLHRRADALFELADAILTADCAPSPVHLSLEAPHRRGWGSFYAALRRGRIDAEALRRLLARHPLAGSQTPVYAVDMSVWPRCDAECSPQRGYYYHPSLHSAGQPIVAGWAYQFVAQVNFARESWTAPVDALRVHPAQEVNAVAAKQIEGLLRRSPTGEGVPLFVFDAGYDPVKLQQALEGCPCQILVRLRAGRRFYADPRLAGPSALTGRPRRHRPKMKCKVAFPESHRRRIRTTNGLERLNQEIKRRTTRVVRIFPNREACLRLVTALAVEQSEEWVTGRRYLDMRELDEQRRQEGEREAEGVVLMER